VRSALFGSSCSPTVPQPSGFSTSTDFSSHRHLIFLVGFASRIRSGGRPSIVTTHPSLESSVPFVEFVRSGFEFEHSRHDSPRIWGNCWRFDSLWLPSRPVWHLRHSPPPRPCDHASRRRAERRTETGRIHPSVRQQGSRFLKHRCLTRTLEALERRRGHGSLRVEFFGNGPASARPVFEYDRISHSSPRSPASSFVVTKLGIKHGEFGLRT
jgi:hypothetical protein